jgi:hypothetical protein
MGLKQKLAAARLAACSAAARKQQQQQQQQRRCRQQIFAGAAVSRRQCSCLVLWHRSSAVWFNGTPNVTSCSNVKQVKRQEQVALVPHTTNSFEPFFSGDCSQVHNALAFAVLTRMPTAGEWLIPSLACSKHTHAASQQAGRALCSPGQAVTRVVQLAPAPKLPCKVLSTSPLVRCFQQTTHPKQQASCRPTPQPLTYTHTQDSKRHNQPGELFEQTVDT